MVSGFLSLNFCSVCLYGERIVVLVWVFGLMVILILFVVGWFSIGLRVEGKRLW